MPALTGGVLLLAFHCGDEFFTTRGEIVNTSVIHDVLPESQAGKLIFPDVVRRLLDVGVESYLCDFAIGTETFYMSDGKTHVEKMILPLAPGG